MIVLDTQVAIWLTTDRRRVSAAAADCIREASRTAEGIAIASSTLWEVAMTYRKGGLRLRITLAEYLREMEKNLTVLPITGSIAERSIGFSEHYPKDPADRIIGATALVHGARLVTADRKIRASGEVNCVW